MPKKKTAGVGTRYGVVFPLDVNGLPNVDNALAVGTLTQGTIVEGIKDFAPTNPAPQRFTHYGEDAPFAQDSLAPTDAGSFSFNTAKKNFDLDAVLMGQNVVTEDGIPMLAGNTEKRGQEPLVMFATYRQALDVGKGSATFGKLRQWDLKIYPSSRITEEEIPFGQGMTQKSYQGTPTLVSQTPWKEAFTTTTWANVLATRIEMTTDYQPRIYVGTGNGTVTKFALPHTPVGTANVHVWVDGTLTAPASVSLSDPSFTMTSAPGNGKLIFVLNETNLPGNS